MKTSDFDYILPEDFIAQTPIEPRDNSRLMVIHRDLDIIEHARFLDLPDYLEKGDVLVLNQTKVIAARLYGYRIPTGGKVEIFLIRQLDDQTWEVLVGGKDVKPGQKIKIDSGPELTVLEKLERSRLIVWFHEPIMPFLNNAGHVPLPPYIHTSLKNKDRYQTIFARYPGSVAAPTAGLHFTQKLLENLKGKGIIITYITLHIGLDTFAPVTEDDAERHPIHSEWCQISLDVARTINEAKRIGKRVIAVGTTTVRTLETACNSNRENGFISVYEGITNLFIIPGYQFNNIDGIVTNFHLPRSTLIMMVSAFYNREKLLTVYENAKYMRYRFYSFGDAMLLL